MTPDGRTLPLWAQRLFRDQPRPDHTRWPTSPEEGLRQSIELADLGLRQWLESLQQEHRALPFYELERMAYRSYNAWQGLRDSLRFRSS